MQSCLKVSWAGMQMALHASFLISLKIKKTPSFLIPFLPKRKTRRRKKGEKGIKKEGIVELLVSPRQIKIKACRAICLLKKLAGMTVYTEFTVSLLSFSHVDTKQCCPLTNQDWPMESDNLAMHCFFYIVAIKINNVHYLLAKLPVKSTSS